MATSYEHRHLPFTTAYIMRFDWDTTPGGATPGDSFLLLEDDPGDGSSRLLLEDDPGDGSSRLKLQDST